MKLQSKKRQFLVYLFFSAASSVLGFLATLAMMQLIPPNEYGRISLFFSVSFFTAPLISFSADSLIAIKKSKLSVDQYEEFKQTSISFSYLLFILAQLIFLCLYFLHLLTDSLYLLIPIAAITRHLIGLTSIEYVMEEKAVQYGLLSFATALLSLLLTLVFLTVFAATADWRILALVSTDLALLYYRYKGRLTLLLTFKIVPSTVNEIVVFGLPLMIALAPAWLLNESDKVVVASYADLSSVGIYAAACAIGGFMITLNAALLNSVVPRLYKALGENPVMMMTTLRRYLFEFVVISMLFAMAFSFFYMLISESILPDKYRAARKVVYLVILFSLARSSYLVLGAVVDYFGMTKEKLRGIVVAGAVALVTILIGVGTFGFAGATAGVGAGYAVLSLILWMYLLGKSRSLVTIL